MVLFDSVVMPVPTEPFGSIPTAELEQLSADAQYLQDTGCARIFPWEPKQFEAWRPDLLNVGLASRVNIENEVNEANSVAYEAAVAQRGARLDRADLRPLRS